MAKVNAKLNQCPPRKITARVIAKRPKISCIQAHHGRKSRGIRSMAAKKHFLVSRIKVNNIVSDRDDFQVPFLLSIMKLCQECQS